MFWEPPGVGKTTLARLTATSFKCEFIPLSTLFSTLVYNWWSWYCKTANPSARMEAITSRPLLLAGVGQASQSGGQTTLYLTPLHGKADLIKTLIANIREALRYVKGAAEKIKSPIRGACWCVM